ncbi:MAG: sulfatase-like hydrolase/transferase [Planctomycetales bacterium]|nr:sulfatase-like hydrolase/transferase [Planctomycetales bacterium]
MTHLTTKSLCVIGISFLFLVGGCSAFVVADQHPTTRPNIVLIYADDQGWRDIGYNSDGTFKTPVLDKLAQEGMVFTNAYTNAANCQPARACLLSGNYTPRHHVFAVHSTNRGPKNQMRLVPIPNRDGLAEADVTIADALQAAGYATGHFGKWHLYHQGGKKRKGGGGALPSEQGFDVTYDSFGEGELPEGSEGNYKGPGSDPKGVFELSKQACDFMEAHQDQPFFVYLAHHAPHSPLNSRKSTRKMIRDPFQACIYDLDASVGRVLDKIKDLGLEKETLVIYTSDNGGSAHSQEPLRGAKGAYYEGGIREPMIAYWPGVIQAGSTCSTPVMQVDYFPTFLEVAGAAVDKELDGESLMPLLKQSGTLKRKSLFWHMPGYLDRPVPRGRDKIFRTRPVSVIRQGRWKLHLYLEEWVLDGGRERIADNNCVELYDLENDIGERTNLAQQHPHIRDALLADLLAWHDTVQAPIPTKKNPAYVQAGP